VFRWAVRQVRKEFHQATWDALWLTAVEGGAGITGDHPVLLSYSGLSGYSVFLDFDLNFLRAARNHNMWALTSIPDWRD
jgi:hypothetical protein